jgi:hypothetical protein
MRQSAARAAFGGGDATDTIASSFGCYGHRAEPDAMGPGALWPAYSPVNCGNRFWLKASIPSRRSFVGTSLL